MDYRFFDMLFLVVVNFWSVSPQSNLQFPSPPPLPSMMDVRGQFGKLPQLPQLPFVGQIASGIGDTLNFKPLDGGAYFGNDKIFPNTKQLSPEDVNFYGKFSETFACDGTPNDVWCKNNYALTIPAKTFRNGTHNTMGKVFVRPERGEIIISYRGTTGLREALLDLHSFAVNLWEIPNSPIKIHLGFWLATMTIYNDVMDEVRTLMRQNPSVNRVSVTGNSLGGAMASVTLFIMNYNPPFERPVEYTLVTFGQPRTGNKAFADYMNKLPIKMGRVVSKSDIVPHVPPVSIAGTQLLGDNFIHHLQEIWSSDGTAKTIKYCSMNVYEDPSCSISRGPLYNVRDHSSYGELTRTFE